MAILDFFMHFFLHFLHFLLWTPAHCMRHFLQPFFIILTSDSIAIRVDSSIILHLFTLHPSIPLHAFLTIFTGPQTSGHSACAVQAKARNTATKKESFMLILQLALWWSWLLLIVGFRAMIAVQVREGGIYIVFNWARATHFITWLRNHLDSTTQPICIVFPARKCS